MKYLLALALILFSLGCFAAMYMRTEPNGNIIYSDTPEDNAKPISLPKGNNSISVPPNSASTASNPELSLPSSGATAAPASEQTGHKGYSNFAMVDPTDQETFQNQRDIPVKMKIDPPLQEGDKVQLYVDGQPAGDPSADLNQLVIHQVDRGEHVLTAALLDNEGHVLKKTDNITVFIHYSAIPTGSGAIAPVPSGGLTPSSPGSGVVPAPRAQPTPVP